MCTSPPPHYQHLNIPYQSGIFATIDEPTLTHQYHPGSIVHIRVHSWWWTFYGFEQMYKDMYPSLWYHREQSHCPKNPLWSVYSSFHTLPRGSGRAPEKWWFWQINFREWKDQRTMKRGGCPRHGPSQQSRQEMVNSIGLAYLFHKDILNCAHFSLRSLSFPLLFYIARILT